MEPWAVAKKKLSVNVAVSSAPVRVHGQRPLAPSVASVTSGIAYSKVTVDLNGTGFAEIRKVIAYCISYEIKSINVIV